MGYIITIGEMEIDRDTEYNRIRITAKGATSKDAPAFGDISDHQNSRYPSYSTWHDFCRFVGLHDLFYDEESGLMLDRPGAAPIHKGVKEEIDATYENFYKKHPGTVPEFAPNDHAPSWPPEKHHLCRLEWLKFWVDWSLENCESPVIVNS